MVFRVSDGYARLLEGLAQYLPGILYGDSVLAVHEPSAVVNPQDGVGNRLFHLLCGLFCILAEKLFQLPAGRRRHLYATCLKFGYAFRQFAARAGFRSCHLDGKCVKPEQCQIHFRTERRQLSRMDCGERIDILPCIINEGELCPRVLFHCLVGLIGYPYTVGYDSALGVLVYLLEHCMGDMTFHQLRQFVLRFGGILHVVEGKDFRETFKPLLNHSFRSPRVGASVSAVYDFVQIAQQAVPLLFRSLLSERSPEPDRRGYGFGEPFRRGLRISAHACLTDVRGKLCYGLCKAAGVFRRHGDIDVAAVFRLALFKARRFWRQRHASFYCH